jgi:glucosyl-dolichyl phosphate glucuronosyltransferase
LPESFDFKGKSLISFKVQHNIYGRAIMDIIICTYNNADLLDKTLSSISLQEVPSDYSWAVIVVDNNCTDDTANVVDKYIDSGKILNLRRISENKQGLTYARICGVKNTCSKWIAFVDDDCLLSQDWVYKAIKFTESHPRCGVFGGKVILDWEIPPTSIFVKHSKSFAASDRGENIEKLSHNDYQIAGAGMVVRRLALEESGWLDKQFLCGREGSKLTAGDDSEIVLRIRNAGYELWYTPDCVLHHFIPTRRISETYLVNMFYGFGVSAPYIASMRWNKSYLIWFIFSLLRIIKGLLQTVAFTIRYLIHKDSKADALIFWNWTKGQIVALINILKMNHKERADWLKLFQI